MGKKGIILSAAFLGIFAIGIVFAVAYLYSSQDDSAAVSFKPAAESYPMMRAVPSDAAAILAFDGSRTAAKVLGDSTGILTAFIAPDATPSLRRYMAEASSRPTIISLHNSGSMVPLIITDTRKNDPSHLKALADSAGLKTIWLEDTGYLLASRSETILNISSRHISDGIAILADESLSTLASTVSGPAVIFINNEYLPKLGQSLITKSRRSHLEFLRRFSSWTALQITPGPRFRIDAIPSAGASPSLYASVLKGTAPGEARFPEIIPEFTSEAISFTTSSIQTYIEAHRHLLDARGRLSRYDKTADQTAARLDLREAAAVTFTDRDSTMRILALRSSSKLPDQKKITPFDDAPRIANLLGDAFKIPGITHSINIGDWKIAGSLPVITAYSEGRLPGNTLKSRLGNADVPPIPSRDLVLTAYCAASEAPSLIRETFTPSLANAISTIVEPGFYTPCILTASNSQSSGLSLTLTVSKTRITRSKAPVQERDTTVTIPTGPFKVKNSGTGKINTFYQNSALSLCLNDENGKGLWGIPFKQRICGRVQEVDYYANGKIQFLFAASDKLYLIDRLGRFVSGFPVTLGKPVKLGPDAYDFSGAHSYRAMVLHSDNSLELYDLHGHKSEGWLGIKAPETVKDLPTLITVNGKKYWIVRTSIRTLIYGFHGGEPITKAEGDKMIRPDAEILTGSGNISAVCYDGKVREIKL